LEVLPIYKSSAMNTPQSRYEILIQECDEPLLDIPDNGRFILTNPHPYEILWAPYKGTSPFRLREQVLSSLIRAAENLSARYPGYKFRIFDAYRPLAVQEFMVIHTAREFCWKVHHIFLNEAVTEIHQEAMDYALKLFAKPNPSPEAPPPHSTGSAIDLTIVNNEWIDISMGSEIDEWENACPNAFEDSSKPQEIVFHHNRMLLKEVMEEAGFVQLPHEWWHFSQGDQTAVFLEMKKSGEYSSLVARYGRVWV